MASILSCRPGQRRPHRTMRRREACTGIAYAQWCSLERGSDILMSGGWFFSRFAAFWVLGGLTAGAVPAYAADASDPSAAAVVAIPALRDAVSQPTTPQPT